MSLEDFEVLAKDVHLLKGAPPELAEVGGGGGGGGGGGKFIQS